MSIPPVNFMIANSTSNIITYLYIYLYEYFFYQDTIKIIQTFSPSKFTVLNRAVTACLCANTIRWMLFISHAFIFGNCIFVPFLKPVFFLPIRTLTPSRNCFALYVPMYAQVVQIANSADILSLREFSSLHRIAQTIFSTNAHTLYDTNAYRVESVTLSRAR